MFRLLISFVMTFGIGLVHADNGTWNTAFQYSQKKDITNLQNVSQQNPNDQAINYLLATTSIIVSQPSIAESFINTSNNITLRTNIVHQLLTYYYDNQQWQNYSKLFIKFDQQIYSNNELCGFDLANFAQNLKQAILTSPDELLRNKMPDRCISLIATKLNNGAINNKYKNIFLYNLITNNQINEFNQSASSLDNKVQNFSSLDSSSNYKTIYQISRQMISSPDDAYNSIVSSSLTSQEKIYLYNLSAYYLAIKQNFTLSQQAINNGDSNYLSDDEQEWRVRTYLALGDWKQVNKAINNMPLLLKNKSVWLYWQAFALSKLDQGKNAQVYLNRIQNDNGFYYFLAQAELNKPIQNYHIDVRDLPDLYTNKDVKLGFDFIIFGNKQNNPLFTKLGIQIINQALPSLNDNYIAVISDKFLSLNMQDIAISTVLKMKNPDLIRAYPTPFLDIYKRYSAQYNIDVAFPLAVSRQESRFKANALAFDGGVGLMQIMPATSQLIARQIGSKNCYKSYICNIQFGTWFLAHLLDKFDGNYIYASAGYNAGPGRAHRWQNAFLSLDNRIQIELIPFKITRDYAQKVNRNKYIYDFLLNRSRLNMIEYLSKINNRDTSYLIDTYDSESGNIGEMSD